MSKFVSLTRVNVLMALYQMSLLRRRTGKRREGRGFAIAIAVLLVIVMAYMGFWAWTLSLALNPVGYEWVVLPIGLLIISGLVLAMGLYTFNSLLFESADTDQLFAYPVSKFTVVAAKVSGIVVENWLVAFVLWLPMVAVYGYFAHPGAAFYVFAVLCWLIAPGVPLFVLGVISYLVGVITSGARLRRLLQVLFTLGLFVGLIFAVRAGVTRLEAAANTSGDVFGLLERYYPPIGFMTTALAKGSWGAMALAILGNVLPFVALCALIASSYAWIRSRITTVTRAKSTHIRYGSSNSSRALIGKEFTRLFTSPMYLLNSLITAALLVVLTAVAGGGDGQLAQVGDALGTVGVTMAQVILIFYLFLLSVSNTTAPSISLEGKNLWLIQSLPVGAASVLRAKLLVQVCTITPLVIIGSVVAIFTARLDAAGFVTVVVPCVLFTLVSACVGLVYNLRFHRFDFYNDQQVVKNSASSVLTMGTMVSTGAVAVVGFWLINRFVATVAFWAYWTVWVVLLAGAVVVLYRYLMTKGVAQFQDLG